MSESLPGASAPAQTSYVPVRVSTLRGDQKISFDLYIQIGTKHILFIRKGDSFEGTRLDRLKERKLRKMFILPDDEPHYRSYIEGNIMRAYDSKSGASIEDRTAVIQGLQQAAAESVFENPGDAQAYAEARAGASQFAELLRKEEKAFKALLSIENTDQNLAAHGVAVATLAVGIAQKLGTVDPKSMDLMALGALIHDLDHARSGIPYHLPISQLSQEQLARFKQHPTEGATLVKDLGHFDQHVIQIILEHEEHADGSGFPKGLIERKCNPLAVIVATANAFDRMVTFEKSNQQDSLKRMVLEKIGRHPLTHINALKALVG
jgi:putative nucleotidyltransferase with HDIG domain